MHIVPHCYFLCKPSAQCCQRPFFIVIFAGINIHAQLSLYILVLNPPLTFFLSVVTDHHYPGKILFLVLLALATCPLMPPQALLLGHGQFWSQCNKYQSIIQCHSFCINHKSIIMVKENQVQVKSVHYLTPNIQLLK